VEAAAKEVDPEPSHANWFENFPWTRLEGVSLPEERKPGLDQNAYRAAAGPKGVREVLGDGVFEGAYELPDEQVLRVWETGVAEVRELLESAWR
jgi:creatinine amidohydrolase